MWFMHLSRERHSARRRCLVCVRRRVNAGGFSLVETVSALGLAGILIGAVVSGYMQCVKTAEWSAYSLAANALALQQLEATRAAKWDRWGGVDEIQASNFPVRVEVLDVPITKTNIVWATNRVFITTVSSMPPLKMVKVECSWRFFNKGVYTNTVATYRAPDQ